MTETECTVARELGSRLRLSIDRAPAARVHGGCISEAYRWQTDRGPIFVKIAPASSLAVFEQEAAGLEALRSANAVRVPRILATGSTATEAFLALEWIDLNHGGEKAEALLGKQLARQHEVLAPEFGWHRPNTIGSTPQLNEPSVSWIEFFRERRLRLQLNLAACNGFRASLQARGAELLERLDDLFAHHRPKPSLLHGDLWGGNWAVDASGAPVIFDPAVYYGDREADLAMTHLFGGFGPAFYRAYEAHSPLPAGAEERVTLYNLYHVLNHLNLFGAGYLAQAEGMIGRLLALTR